MNTAAVDQTLSQLATSHPAASRVFQRYGLDYCCKGGQTLESACRHESLDPDALLLEILTAQEPKIDWGSHELPALIEHVLERYHQTARSELPDLVHLAQRVEQRHADKESCPLGLADFLTAFGKALLLHMRKEEQVLFPLFLSGRGSLGAIPVEMMELEHQSHGKELKRMRELTDNYLPPPDACPTWRALYLRLEEFERDLMDHVAFEQELLFPRGLSQKGGGA